MLGGIVVILDYFFNLNYYNKNNSSYVNSKYGKFPVSAY